MPGARRWVRNPGGRPEQFKAATLTSQVMLEVKNPPANAGDIRDAVSIPGLGRSPEEGDDNPSFLAWRIPRTEEPSGLQSMKSQRVG